MECFEVEIVGAALPAPAGTRMVVASGWLEKDQGDAFWYEQEVCEVVAFATVRSCHPVKERAVWDGRTKRIETAYEALMFPPAPAFGEGNRSRLWTTTELAWATEGAINEVSAYLLLAPGAPVPERLPELTEEFVRWCVNLKRRRSAGPERGDADSNIR